MRQRCRCRDLTPAQARHSFSDFNSLGLHQTFSLHFSSFKRDPVRFGLFDELDPPNIFSPTTINRIYTAYFLGIGE